MIGTKLVAIDTCVMNDGKPRLTVGRTYEVIDSGLFGVDELCYVIINDNGDRHHFTVDKIKNFFKIK